MKIAIVKAAQDGPGWVVDRGDIEDLFPDKGTAERAAKGALNDGTVDGVAVVPVKEGGIATIHWKSGSPLDQLLQLGRGRVE